MQRSVKWLKRIRRIVLGRRPGDASTVLIVGCQRSGTSLLLQLIERDWRAHVLGEMSELFIDRPGDRRMIPNAAAVTLVKRQPVRLVAVKPLVESHRVPELLDIFPNATGVWLFRDVREVARSNLAIFGVDNGRRDLAPILARSTRDWRAMGVSDETLDLVQDLARHRISDLDAAALFWLVRNALFFDRGYAADDRLATCSYRDLVCRPAEVVQNLYRRASQPYPGDRVVRGVFKSSLGRTTDVDLHPEIEAACSVMWERLCAVDMSRGLVSRQVADSG